MKKLTKAAIDRSLAGVNELNYPDHGSANLPYEVEITDHRGNTSYHYCEETDLAACMWAIRELNPTTLQGATAITIRLDGEQS